MAQQPLGPPPFIRQEHNFDRWIRMLWQRIAVEGQILWTQVIKPTVVKNTFLAGPTTGADAAAAFRAIVAADLGTGSASAGVCLLGDLTWGKVAIANTADAIQDLFAQVNWGSAGTESADAIEVPATIQDMNGNTLAVATTEVEVMVSDSDTNATPSGSATLTAAGTPVGTILSGSGTATATWRTSASGTFTVSVSEAGTGARYLWVRQGLNSQAFVRANASPKSTGAFV